MDEAVQAYIDGIAPQNRPLFDRLHGLILGTLPGRGRRLSYGMPAYRWAGGVSTSPRGSMACRSTAGRRAARPASPPAIPELKTSKGTIQLRPGRSAGIGDGELLELIAGRAGGLTVNPA